MNTRGILTRLVAVVAAIFGAATLLAGGRVLAGGDPGYVVFLPLLLFNTAMAVVDLVTAAITWLNPRRGRIWVRGVFLVNLLVLAAIVVLFAAGETIAVDSLGAMTFRTVVWGAGVLALSRPSGACRNQAREVTR